MADLKLGDHVRVTGIPSALPEQGDLRTKDIFSRCVGHVFSIVGFQGELLELEVGEVAGEAPYMHSIWIEPQFVELVRRKAGHASD